MYVTSRHLIHYTDKMWHALLGGCDRWYVFFACFALRAAVRHQVLACPLLSMNHLFMRKTKILQQMQNQNKGQVQLASL